MKKAIITLLYIATILFILMYVVSTGFVVQ